MTTNANLSNILASIDKKLKTACKHLEDIYPDVDIEKQLEPWIAIREYLGRTTKKSVISSASLMAPNVKRAADNYGSFAPLLEIPKLPIDLRLELAEMIEALVDDLTLHLSEENQKSSMDKFVDNLSFLITLDKPNIGKPTKGIKQDVEKMLDKFLDDLTKFSDKHKKNKAVDALTVSTTIAALGGFLAGVILAPFAPLALSVVAARYMNRHILEKRNTLANAIGAGMVGFLAGTLLIPFIPLIVAAFPIINDTAIFNFQLDKMKEGTKSLKEALAHDKSHTASPSPRNR